MEQHEKEERNTEEKKKKDSVTEEESTQSKSTLSFPLDLTSEILLRLPAEKSVVRFRCVSKLWSSVTTDPYFINLFETRSPTRPSLLLCFKKVAKVFVSSIPQHHSDKSCSSSHPIYQYHMKLKGKHSDFSPTESVHGLICLQGSATPIVWNPRKKKFLPLPKPSLSRERRKVFLGYHPIEGKHKVMCMPLGSFSHVCRVLTLGSAQESWREVKINHRHCASYNTYGRCINGVIYYVAMNGMTCDFVIMSFDVKSEKFDTTIEIPWGIHSYVLINYEGMLACTDRYQNDGRLWILEDAEKHRWSESILSFTLG